jgi:hypothetical protein
MSIIFRAMKGGAAIVVAAALLLVLPAAADAQTTGSVRFKVVSGGFILGGGGGTGTLTFRGKTYPLRVGGLGVDTIIGVSSADFVGAASNLRSPQDIAGTYSVAGAGLTVVGGVSAVTLQNSNGVVLRLRGRQAGLKATLGVGGVEIRMP